MQPLSKLITKQIGELGGNPALFASITKNNTNYKSAIKKIWRDKRTSEFILSHTNAFYIRKDTRPKKGKDKDKDHYLAEIVIDDAVVRSEVDTHREMIFAHLLNAGVNIEEIKIIPAKGNMRKRHPFGKGD